MWRERDKRADMSDSNYFLVLNIFYLSHCFVLLLRLFVFNDRSLHMIYMFARDTAFVNCSSLGEFIFRALKFIELGKMCQLPNGWSGGAGTSLDFSVH